MVSSWKNFAFRAYAAKVTWKKATLQSKQERLVAESSGGSNNQSESNDPAKEKPTDETIKVKITDISYNFVKKDGIMSPAIQNASLI